jgi:7,8-dihydropterin-6-yl-methyl-4-(beta-D-ribofuranosyl)aminobenzene 5'-phosphate synthase
MEMQITVLVDNNAAPHLYGEWGLSFLIEDQGIKVLFDTGGSDLFIQNAAKLGVDLFDLDYIVLSHGHWDHSWGLGPLIKLYLSSKAESRRPKVIAHPYVLLPKRKPATGEENGAVITAETVSRVFPVQFSKTPVKLSDRLIFLGEIERKFAFEEFEPTHQIIFPDGSTAPDCLVDDSALAYQTSEGLVIISGCAHSGICNTIEYAKKVCGEQRIIDVIGGFHLVNPPADKLKGTVSYLDSLGLSAFHVCHCVDLASKVALAQVRPLDEIRVGSRLNFT